MICCVINLSADSRLALGLKLSGARLRKSVSRMSRSMSLVLITWAPAITAMRSRTTAPETIADKTKIESQARMLKSLSNRKGKLEMADTLRRTLAVARQLRRGNVRRSEEHTS